MFHKSLGVNRARWWMVPVSRHSFDRSHVWLLEYGQRHYFVFDTESNDIWYSPSSLRAGAIAQKIESITIDTNHRLDKWIQNYDLVCEFVDKLNQFFGLMLLFFFAKLFIIFITNSFSIFIGIQIQTSLAYLYRRSFSSSLCQVFINVTILEWRYGFSYLYL